MPIGQQQLDQYRRAGYTVARGLLDPPTLRAWQELVDDYVRRQTADGRRPEHLDKPHLHDARFLELCRSPAVLELARAFLGLDVLLFSTHLICKSAGDGLEVPWHQDAHFWPLEPMEVITLWIALDDSTLENGCMQVIPGTHTLGPLPHHDDQHPQDKVLHAALADDSFDPGAAVPVELRAGDCSVHAPYLIHGSARNTSDRRRCGLTMRLMPTTTRLRRDGPLARWFGEMPLYLLCGRDRAGVNERVITLP